MLELKSLYEKKGIDVVAISVLGKDRETVGDVVRKNNVHSGFSTIPQVKQQDATAESTLKEHAH